jgi:predicted murein hydrolase (TIGR00659 family)
VKETWVDAGSRLPTKHLAFFFIPIAVGLMEWGPLFWRDGASLVCALAVSTLAAQGIAGGLGQRFSSACRRLFLKYGHALLSPVFLSTIVIITALVVFRVPFDQYRPARDIMTILLGPAVVALALPLYRQRRILVKRLPVVVASVMSGSLVSIVSVVAVARLLSLDETILVSLAPKSVTAPIAIEISRIAGGDQALTAAFVIVTGLLGSMLGPWFLSTIGVHDPVARGLAVGNTSHGQGTAMMLLEGETPGTLSGVSMALTAVFTSFIGPIVIPWLT